MLNLKLESINKKCLYLYTYFILKIFSIKNYKYKINFLPIKKKKITFLKSPHVFKRSKEHFELKKYKINININTSFDTIKNVLINKPNTIKTKLNFIKKMI